jgi:hypothetical protein
MTNQHTTRYYPATKKDHEVKPEEILTDEAYKNAKTNAGMDTNTHTHRYVPSQRYYKWKPAPIQTGHTSRYVPVTAKDSELNRDDILKYDAYRNVKENEGIDTNTHSSRYIPGHPAKADQ